MNSESTFFDYNKSSNKLCFEFNFFDKKISKFESFKNKINSFKFIIKKLN